MSDSERGFSARLRRAMKDAGVNGKELAKLAETTPAVVSGWVTGKTRNPQRSSVEKVAEVLGVTYEWLWYGASERPEDPEAELVVPAEVPVDRIRREHVEELRELDRLMGELRAKQKMLRERKDRRVRELIEASEKKAPIDDGVLIEVEYKPKYGRVDWKGIVKAEIGQDRVDKAIDDAGYTLEAKLVIGLADDA